MKTIKLVDWTKLSTIQLFRMGEDVRKRSKASHGLNSSYWMAGLEVVSHASYFKTTWFVNENSFFNCSTLHEMIIYLQNINILWRKPEPSHISLKPGLFRDYKENESLSVTTRGNEYTRNAFESTAHKNYSN